MPWKGSVLMDEKMKFVGRLLEGEKMAGLCQEFCISRKTGYKFWDRYKKVGLHALTDRSRRPVRYANQLPIQIITGPVRYVVFFFFRHLARLPWVSEGSS